MTSLIEKLSSYNLFNYLVPGAVFAALSGQLTSYSLIQSDLALGVFVYYFAGLTISRFGSLILEPILLRVRFVSFAEYRAFVEASKADSKLETLLEANNTYRTFAALFLLLLGLKAFEALQNRVEWFHRNGLTALIVLLLALFLFSFRKQSTYITKRVGQSAPR